jgi:hypothetical protein
METVKEMLLWRKIATMIDTKFEMHGMAFRLEKDGFVCL